MGVGEKFDKYFFTFWAWIGRILLVIISAVVLFFAFTVGSGVFFSILFPQTNQQVQQVALCDPPLIVISNNISDMDYPLVNKNKEFCGIKITNCGIYGDEREKYIDKCINLMG